MSGLHFWLGSDGDIFVIYVSVQICSFIDMQQCPFIVDMLLVVFWAFYSRF